MLFLVILFFSAPLFGNFYKEFYDFNGRNSIYWHWVTLSKDQELLHQCASLYAQKHPHHLCSIEDGVPEIIHMIWLGPDPFPSVMLGVLYSWQFHHPEWLFYFWTDRPREGLPEFVSIQSVSDFHFLSLGECFYAAKNWAEKSDILRYEIIYQKGGVYVDHDAFCLKSFLGLHHLYHFYCALEVPHPATHFSSAISLGNGLFGAVPKHPVLHHLLFDKKLQILEIMEKYSEDTLNRVMKGSFGAFSSSVFELLEKKELGQRDVIFPAAYFWGRDTMPCLYSVHFYRGSWL